MEGGAVAGAKGPHCRATLDIQRSIGLCVYHAGFLGMQGKCGAVQVFLIYRASAGVLAALEPTASSGPDCHRPFFHSHVGGGADEEEDQWVLGRQGLQGALLVQSWSAGHSPDLVLCLQK